MSECLWTGKGYRVQIQYTCGVFLGLKLCLSMHPYINSCDFHKVVHSNVRCSRLKLMLGKYIGEQLIQRVWWMFYISNEIFRCVLVCLCSILVFKEVSIRISCTSHILVKYCKFVLHVFNMCFNMWVIIHFSCCIYVLKLPQKYKFSSTLAVYIVKCKIIL